MNVESGVPTVTAFDIVECSLEAMGELVAIYQVSVECRRIEAGARFVEQRGGGEDGGGGELLVEHEVRKGVVEREGFAKYGICECPTWACDDP